MKRDGHQVADSPYLVPFDGSFRVKDAVTRPGKKLRDDDENREAVRDAVDKMNDLQERLHAEKRAALLVVFQAMDAAGKDGTIRAVFSGLNPAGLNVRAFGVPSEEEVSHDFLWRVWQPLPARGMIGVFNRSHYEEVLVVRVHPEFLGRQQAPRPKSLDRLWPQRYEAIREMEQHLARGGTRIVKFWLNVSRDEQRKRFLARAEEEKGHWKFKANDVRERGHWDSYMEAYEDALNATSRPWAPWYAIPADDKKYMRRAVAEIVLGTLEQIDPHYPELDAEARAEMKVALAELEKEG